MNALRFEEWLEHKDACRPAINWAEGKTPRKAWAQCERADWMTWAACRVGVSRKCCMLAVRDCIEILLPHIPNAFDDFGVFGVVSGLADALADALSNVADDSRDTRETALAQMAHIVRKRIPWSVVEVSL